MYHHSCWLSVITFISFKVTSSQFSYQESTQRNLQDPRFPDPRFPDATRQQFQDVSQINLEEQSCPRYWEQFGDSCYRFIRSPIRDFKLARRNCQAYNADLVSLDNLEEHAFLVGHLQHIDPQHRRWYVGVRQRSPGAWLNEKDSSQLVNMDPAFLKGQTATDRKDYLTYSFSDRENRWGLEKVSGDDPLLFICEILRRDLLQVLLDDDRDADYGFEVTEPLFIPRGPFFIQQPSHVVFDLGKHQQDNFVYIRCLAGGYPTPTYTWFKEEYVNDQLVSKLVDPLAESRFTISGGTLIIHNPKQLTDRGNYHCVAENKYGAIVSETVQLSFGYIGEFVLKRSPESGHQFWGKAIFCDPPQHFPEVSYYWARTYFPNFVEEDPRVFVSNDGNLYFSYLDNIDIGTYSCNVQSNVSSTGRNGPFFRLDVLPHSNYQQLKFPNNFPKAFPESPKAGSSVRLECVAFGYPVPKYNWTRRNSVLPRGAQLTNSNRVLNLHNVKVEDQGEYVCRAFNAKVSIEASVTLSIQAEPIFTINIGDRHVDKGANLTWTCEAFGIPDVTYTWLRNGQLIVLEEMPQEDRLRYTIQDNVFSVRNVDPQRDPAMFQCRASNSLGARYSSGQLRVLMLKPSFRKHPLETETLGAEGGNVTIICNPEAAPRPKFTWKKDGIVLGSGGRRRILMNGNLIIMPVSRDDQGLYMCTAQNVYGMEESSGRLVVLKGPSLTEYPPTRITTIKDNDLKLRCRASADQSLDMAIIWNHNGIRIYAEDYNPHIVVNEYDNSLLLDNITYAESGEYECVAKTSVGIASATTEIKVEGPPGPPGGIQVINPSARSATIHWTDGISNGRPILYYTVEGRTNWNQTWRNLAENITAKEVDRLTGRKEAFLRELLSPWSTYEFRIRAANAYGYGLPSSASPQYNTRSATPSTAPIRVWGGGGKTGDLTIQWEPIPPEEQNAPGIHYKIFWRRAQGDLDTEYQSLELKAEGNVGMHVVRIQTQYYYTLYEVKVQAWNDLGEGPVSKPSLIYSAEDMPQAAPTQPAARSFNATAVNVTWLPIDETRAKIRGKLIGHRIKYWRELDKEEDAQYFLSRFTHPWGLVVGLQPDTYYYVRVMAYNKAGPGPESERFLERTFKKPPQKQPSGVVVKAIDPSTIHVVWRYVAPSIDEEPLIGYKVRVWEADQDMSQANDTYVTLGGKLESFVTGLTPGKVYMLRVLAHSQGGDGKMSSPIWEFQMGDPEALKASSKSVEPIGGLLTILLLTVIWISVCSACSL